MRPDVPSAEVASNAHCSPADAFNPAVNLGAASCGADASGTTGMGPDNKYSKAANELRTQDGDCEDKKVVESCS